MTDLDAIIEGLAVQSDVSFVPTESHRDALDPRTLVVLGESGSGKSALLRMLHRVQPASNLRAAMGAAPHEQRVRILTAEVPPSPVREVLSSPPDVVPAENEASARLWWLIEAAKAIDLGLRGLPDWPARSGPPAWLMTDQRPPDREATAALLGWLASLHHELEARGEAVLLVYDEPTQPLASLLGLWIALRKRYSRYGARVLLRPEVFATLQLNDSDRDALRGAVATLRWSMGDLFRVVAARLDRISGISPWIREVCPFETFPLLGEVPVPLAEEGPRSAVELAGLIAGKHVGRGVLRAYTSRWLMEVLKGARGAVTPRRLLTLLAEAARWQRERGATGGPPWISEDALQVGLAAVSEVETRALIAERQLPDAVWALRQVLFPAPRATLVQLLDEALVRELVTLGVLVESGDRLDIRELYRLAFGASRGAAQTPTPTHQKPPTPREPKEAPLSTPTKGPAMTPEQVRSTLIDALRLDLVGPDPDEATHAAHATETLPTAPSTWYLTGFLVPFQAAEADETASEQLDLLRPNPGADDDAAPEKASARKVLFPSSIGLSVLVPAGTDALDVEVAWGDYNPRLQTDGAEEETPAPRAWTRRPGRASVSVQLDARDAQPVPDSGGLMVKVAARAVPAGPDPEHPLVPPGTRAVSVFVVNQRPAASDSARDTASAFQVRLAVRSERPFVARPDLRGHASSERDDQVGELQYRDVFEYAVGHGVATTADLGPDGHCRQVRTQWVPTADVERVEPCKVQEVELGMERLAALTDGASARAALGALPEQYAEWIATQRKSPLDTGPRRELARALLDEADYARRRIEAGIAALEDARALQAFTLANAAMAAAGRRRAANQQGKAPADVAEPTWRPFQLAFLLLNLVGVVDPTHYERKTVDLLFFPTGGGKTEAYLGLAAFTLVWRRLCNPGLSGAGVCVLMRYTLRLLTFDQLGRASALICALELERQRKPDLLGPWPFEIGLWVGKAATPNRMGSKDHPDPESARVKVDRFQRGKGPSPIPLETCPWCSTPFKPVSFQLMPNQNYPTDLRLICVNRSCAFNGRNSLPIVTVDEPIYRRLPCFVVATVDKFAQLPWVGESGKLLGRVERFDRAGFYGPTEPSMGAPLPGGALLPPDLVIQDELHLISGPLGTMVGLYETALDALCARDVAGVEVRPKIVASTATVRRAERQIQALFGRPAVAVFPPPGPDRRHSFFAETVPVEAVPGRRYVGVAAQGRSLKVVFLRTLLALMGAAQTAWDQAGGKRARPNPADAYMSVVAYFNSLRELGGSRRIVEDEVASRLAGYGARRREGEATGLFCDRRIGQPVELTSRESTSKVSDTKRRLELSFHDDDRVDVALATNMISVGLDIVRLGLMVVVGQPKMSAEYIQATSRVGRDPSRPGLVVTLMNMHRPRDRSHYESFAAFHASFYRSVEATSVTPFAPRAVDRGLAGVTVSLARHGLRELTPSSGAVQMRLLRGRAAFVADVIASRAAQHRHDLDPAELEALRERTRGQVGDLLDDWVKIADRKNNVRAGLRYQKFEPGTDAVLLRDPLAADLDAISPEERRFKANRSMRDVELSVNLWAKTLDGLDVEVEGE